MNNAHSVSYSYDDDGLVTAAGDLTLVRDPDTGFIESATVGGVVETRTYNGFGEIAELETKVFGATTFKQVFVRDLLGRITQKTETIDGTTKIYSYAYDPNGRLEEVLIDGISTAIYTYDKNGNRLSRNSELGVCKERLGGSICGYLAAQEDVATIMGPPASHDRTSCTTVQRSFDDDSAWRPRP